MKGCWGHTAEGYYSVQAGYKWYLNCRDTYRWAKLAWSSLNMPSHIVTLWLMLKNKLPINSKIAAYTQVFHTCPQCLQGTETQGHLFFDCKLAREVWEEMTRWTRIKLQHTEDHWLNAMLNLKLNECMKQIIYAVVASVVYHI